MELRLTLRRGESVLLTFLMPAGILIFFSLVDVLPSDTERSIDFLLPGVLALAIMSTSFVSLAIATGFERQTGVLKRLGATPLSRGQLLAAKTAAVVMIELLQVAMLVVIGLLLGFRFDAPSVMAALAAAVLGTIALAGLGLLLAGSLPALTTLAVANGVYLLLLLLGGMVFPLDRLPGALETVAHALPSTALAEIFHGTIGGGSAPLRAWVVLSAWTVAAPVAAARWFRWE